MIVNLEQYIDPAKNLIPIPSNKSGRTFTFQEHGDRIETKIVTISPVALNNHSRLRGGKVLISTACNRAALSSFQEKPTVRVIGLSQDDLPSRSRIVCVPEGDSVAQGAEG